MFRIEITFVGFLSRIFILNDKARSTTRYRLIMMMFPGILAVIVKIVPNALLWFFFTVIVFVVFRLSVQNLRAFLDFTVHFLLRFACVSLFLRMIINDMLFNIVFICWIPVVLHGFRNVPLFLSGWSLWPFLSRFLLRLYGLE